MQVLDLGHNALCGRLTITGLPSLRALMLNGNQLTGIEGTVHTLVQISCSQHTAADYMA